LPHNLYTFRTLSVVTEYQRSKLIENGVEHNFKDFPQIKIAALEQSWNRSNDPESTDPQAAAAAVTDLEYAAENICYAYEYSKNIPDYYIGTTHAFLQIPGQNIGSGLIPGSAGLDFSNAHNYATALAYHSTSLLNWNKNNDHYCCDKHDLGCVIEDSYPVDGVVDAVDGIDGREIRGWALDDDDLFKPVQISVYVDAPASSSDIGFTTWAYIFSHGFDSYKKGNHHYKLYIPKSVPAGEHTFYVYGIDHQGNARELSNSPITAVIRQ